MSVYIKITFNDSIASYHISNTEQVIGRNQICDIVINEDQISGMHCSIYLDDKKNLVIKDLDSKNGTYLNGIKKKTFNFYLGDIVRIGSAQILIDEDKTSQAFKSLLSYKGDKSKRSQSGQNLELDLSILNKKKKF